MNEPTTSSDVQTCHMLGVAILLNKGLSTYRDITLVSCLRKCTVFRDLEEFVLFRGVEAPYLGGASVRVT